MGVGRRVIGWRGRVAALSWVRICAEQDRLSSGVLRAMGVPQVPPPAWRLPLSPLPCEPPETHRPWRRCLCPAPPPPTPPHPRPPLQANRPVPRRCLLYYWEVTVREGLTSGSVTVGLSDRPPKQGRHPG